MFVRNAGNFFLIAFALDGAVSLADDLFQLAEMTRVVGARNAVAGVVLIATFPVVLIVAATRALPAKVFLPLVAFILWASLGAAPLALWFDWPERVALVASAIQLALAVYAFCTLRLTAGGFLLPPTQPGQTDFRPLRLAGFAAGVVLLGPPLLAGYGVVALVSFSHQSTGGFLELDTAGIHLVERRYQLDEREIRLVGMMHVAREGTYAQIFDSFEHEDTLVLEEGVSDEQGLLAGRLPYDILVEPLGLERQVSMSGHFGTREEADAWPHFRNADIDSSELGPETLAYLHALDDVVSALEDRDWNALQEIRARPQMQPDKMEQVMGDIVALRDEHLADELEAALETYPRVIVPWGALHQRHISSVVEEWGFVETESLRHLALEWPVLWRGVRALAEAHGGAAAELEASGVDAAR